MFALRGGHVDRNHCCVILMGFPDCAESLEKGVSNGVRPIACTHVRNIEYRAQAQRLDAIACEDDDVTGVEREGPVRAADDVDLGSVDGGTQMVAARV